MVWIYLILVTAFGLLWTPDRNTISVKDGRSHRQLPLPSGTFNWGYVLPLPYDHRWQLWIFQPLTEHDLFVVHVQWGIYGILAKYLWCYYSGRNLRATLIRIMFLFFSSQPWLLAIRECASRDGTGREKGNHKREQQTKDIHHLYITLFV